ncbi:[protein-PII] uridylyltransferase [Corallincola spongiicola]|uniref:Bifunctional uridylyltransferase/uridylyl-removing enzyme n=1 Tax=Corallincola spongiicola TaxID=2520508 RepID=A0ABY1WN75_9GAMM|nr:[protein-PII] uridylyltransferase [Corallincola spongiicola]TAA43758.1 [protein-PII] uridylyltransferase [Corallincola spongiicola]
MELQQILNAIEELTIDGKVTDYRTANSDFLNWLRAQYQSGLPVTTLVHHRATFVDALLSSLWQRCGLNEIKDLSLVAVGGYGRGELHPQSDVDILVLAKRQVPDSAKSQISEFITWLWDIRLEVGQAVRSVKECLQLGKNDITIGTNLLESRLICGATTPFDKLQDAVQSKRFWPSSELYQAKLAEQQTRHEQFHDTGYNLEPNIKSNPGGLRDIQTIGWVAKSHFNANSLQELISHNFLTEEEHQELIECQTFLWQVRFILHVETERSENRLLFEHQPQIAAALGYCDDGSAAVEKMMKRFYQTIRRVRELNDMLMQLFDQEILGSNNKAKLYPIDDDFQRRGEMLEIIDEKVFERRPEAMLELFLHIADDPAIKGINAETIRQLRISRRNFQGYMVDHPQYRRLFVQLLKHPRGMGRPVSRMHKHSMLALYFPLWQQIVGQMQFDLFHAYTVDEHTYRLLQNTYHFLRPRAEQNFPLCGELLRKMRKPELLFLAGLFHDIGKGRGGDHSVLGAVDALAFCKQHGFNQQDSEIVAWLVKSHLLMSVTAQKRDIYDPDVVKEFAEKVGDEKRLDFLYCLTVADICATNDNLWNTWKAALLRELYFATQSLFRNGMELDYDPSEQVANIRADAEKALLKRFPLEQVELLLSRFFDDYFLRHTPEQIAWHGREIINHQSDEPLILISKQMTRGGTEIFIYTKDCPGLFAKTVGVLDRKGLNVHDAQIQSTRDDHTLDSFVVLEQDGEPLTAPHRVEEIKRELLSSLTSPATDREATRRPPTQMRHFSVATKVKFLNVEDHSRTMLELVALDYPGLLATIGDIFETHDVYLQAAKITTIGERAEDFFILTNSVGGGLEETARIELQHALEAQINQTID